MLKNFRNFVRHYHPGFSKKNKLALPHVIVDTSCLYYNPVWGNGIQESQLKKGKIGYDTFDINYYSYLIQTKDPSALFIETCHDQSIQSALASCRKLKKDKFTSFVQKLDIIDDEGVFINNENNREKIKLIKNEAENKVERDILEGVVWGILSNFADSIYIANNYLLLDNNYAIICNYPDKASSREVERKKIIEILLSYGKIPIILDDEINFEGEANIRLLPIKIGDKRLCLNYHSTRSDPNAINNINKYLRKLGETELLPITLKPKAHKTNQFYHLDCIINFYQDEEKSYHNLEDFYRDKGCGMALIVKDSFNRESEYLINKIFGKIIYLDDSRDNLIANAIVTPEYVVAGAGLSDENIDEIKKTHSLIQYKHPSSGGGGAHKCCSNVISISDEISYQDWTEFNSKIR